MKWTVCGSPPSWVCRPSALLLRTWIDLISVRYDYIIVYISHIYHVVTNFTSSRLGFHFHDSGCCFFSRFGKCCTYRRRKVTKKSSRRVAALNSQTASKQHINWLSKARVCLEVNIYTSLKEKENCVGTIKEGTVGSLLCASGTAITLLLVLVFSVFHSSLMLSNCFHQDCKLQNIINHDSAQWNLDIKSKVLYF